MYVYVARYLIPMSLQCYLERSNSGANITILITKNLYCMHEYCSEYIGVRYVGDEIMSDSVIMMCGGCLSALKYKLRTYHWFEYVGSALEPEDLYCYEKVSKRYLP